MSWTNTAVSVAESEQRSLHFKFGLDIFSQFAFKIFWCIGKGEDSFHFKIIIRCQMINMPVDSFFFSQMPFNSMMKIFLCTAGVVIITFLKSAFAESLYRQWGRTFSVKFKQINSRMDISYFLHPLESMF